MGERVNIYLPTKELHESMKSQAGREGKSLSEYLVNIHCEHLNCLGNSKWRDDRVELDAPVKHKNIGDKCEDFFAPKPKKGKK